MDELISYEEGMRFQALAIVLAKLKWNDLIASEWHNDSGIDAYAPASLAEDKKGKYFASSHVATLGKIRGDATKAKAKAADVEILIFATPKPVTNYVIGKWAEAIRKEFGLELIVMPREEIISSLMIPSNIPLCRSKLGIQVPIESDDAELIAKVREATAEVAKAWATRTRAPNRPIISLTGYMLDGEGKETSELIDTDGLQIVLAESRRLTLEAPGGTGKTTTLVKMAMEAQTGRELHFLVDLADWIRSNVDILAYISRAQAFLSRNITATDLARLANLQHFSFLLNGWNEVAEIHSTQGGTALAQLDRDFPNAGIIVATRTHHVSPPLPGATRVKLRSLNRQQRAGYLREVLGEKADDLRQQIEGNGVLDSLTRTPLILAEVVTIYQSGRPVPTTRIGVLGEVMKLVEASTEHRSHLQTAPLSNKSAHYLEHLAAQMLSRGEVLTDEESALEITQSANAVLRARGHFSVDPNPSDVLHTLSAHHVLEQIDHPSIAYRFQHQQFQEFYAARFLTNTLATLTKEGDQAANRAFAANYVNKPLWQESLLMIAEEIARDSEDREKRTGAVSAGVRLVTVATAVDPIFAADLAGLCGLAVCDLLPVFHTSAD